MPDRDMLRVIMDMQAAFQATVPDGALPATDTTPAKAMEMVRTQTLACIDELTEALHETGWKPWATSNHINVMAFRSELIDAFRFWLNLVIISGMSADDVFDAYKMSMRKTQARVENGYDGVTGKCPKCHRAYDDKPITCVPAGQHPGWCAVYGEIAA